MSGLEQAGLAIMVLSLVEIAVWSFLRGRGSISPKIYPFLMVAAVGTGILGAFLFSWG
ncbi:hypothetical protein [uncultured Meiothermus sp.]|jgi:hypothetical protein|uniref:hypothetical protein n=1 Tax=uncultured Meiothermus sp. TaxID=157471 RepID=UPI00262C7BDB|nr:hypothetical protein [uncultured Meiothermus sp.]